jgi:hypothetical protein
MGSIGASGFSETSFSDRRALASCSATIAEYFSILPLPTSMIDSRSPYFLEQVRRALHPDAWHAGDVVAGSPVMALKS